MKSFILTLIILLLFVFSCENVNETNLGIDDNPFITTDHYISQRSESIRVTIRIPDTTYFTLSANIDELNSNDPNNFLISSAEMASLANNLSDTLKFTWKNNWERIRDENYSFPIKECAIFVSFLDNNFRVGYWSSIGLGENAGDLLLKLIKPISGMAKNELENSIQTFKNSTYDPSIDYMKTFSEPRFGHTTIQYYGLIWNLGGGRFSSNYNNITGSQYGNHWTSLINNSGWERREGHTSYKEGYLFSMWIYGGRNGENYFNDVWHSSDGINWIQVTGNAKWIPRANHTTVNHIDGLYVIGGNDGNEFFNDVWASGDGENWKQVTGSAEWDPRAGHTTVQHLGSIWVIGGKNENGYLNDVWRSDDGKQWTKVTSSAEWSPRAEHTTIQHSGSIWVIGGKNKNGYFNDVWSSNDGKYWSKVNAGVGWSPRAEHTTIQHSGSIWVIGGRDENKSYNDVWSSSNGENWIKAAY